MGKSLEVTLMWSIESDGSGVNTAYSNSRAYFGGSTYAGAGAGYLFTFLNNSIGSSRKSLGASQTKMFTVVIRATNSSRSFRIEPSQRPDATDRAGSSAGGNTMSGPAVGDAHNGTVKIEIVGIRTANSGYTVPTPAPSEKLTIRYENLAANQDY